MSNYGVYFCSFLYVCLYVCMVEFSGGVSETAFKHRYANHNKAFNNIKYQTNTELWNEYLNIISANKTPNISCEILGTYKSSNQSSRRCLQCLNEKLTIALHKGDNMLNKTSGVIANAGTETNTC